MVACDLYYASGSNQPGEVAGFADLGMPLGVTVHELSDDAMEQLRKDAHRIRYLFVDSGAFGEVDRKNVFNTVKPITDEEWERRLSRYDELADIFGSKMACVAPDKVADQKETLRRMNKFRHRMQQLRHKGVKILVPVQRGEHKMTTFYRLCSLSLGIGLGALTPAIPMRKGATPQDMLVEFVEEMQPDSLHLLGMGDTNRSAPRMLKALRAAAPDMFISMDSCLVTASVGKTNGRANHPRERKGGPRILTQANSGLEGQGLSTFDRKRQAIHIAFGPDALWSPKPGQQVVREFSMTFEVIDYRRAA